MWAAVSEWRCRSIPNMPPCCVQRAASGGRWSGAPAGSRAFSPTLMDVTGSWKGSLRSMRPENSSVCGHVPLSASAPIHQRTPRSLRPTIPRTVFRASTWFRRSMSTWRWCWPMRCRWGPIAGRAGRRRSIWSSVWSIRRHRRWILIPRNCVSATSFRLRRCPTQRRMGRSTTAANSNRFWKRRRRSPTGAAFRRAARFRSETESYAASVSAAFLKLPAAFSTKPSTCGSNRTARSRCVPAFKPWGRDTFRHSCR